jgi:hypothetical protein
MIRLTVLYNLPPDADEASFVGWRLSTHAEYIRTMPDVVNASFGRIVDQWSNGTPSSYRFQSTVDWPDRERFERAFYSEQTQADLKRNLGKLGDYRFIVTEMLAGA